MVQVAVNLPSDSSMGAAITSPPTSQTLSPPVSGSVHSVGPSVSPAEPPPVQASKLIASTGAPNESNRIPAEYL